MKNIEEQLISLGFDERERSALLDQLAQFVFDNILITKKESKNLERATINCVMSLNLHCSEVSMEIPDEGIIVNCKDSKTYYRDMVTYLLNEITKPVVKSSHT